MLQKIKQPMPTPEDLINKIQFDYQNGKIWLDEHRMLLIHSSVMGSLRKELITTLGVERARGFLMRFGYQSGIKDAELAHKLRPDMSKAEAFMVGPQLHGLKGMVKAELETLDIDLENGKFYSEFNWHGSFESDIHTADFGITAEPICWMLLGYASGFSSYFVGRKIIFKETQCRGQGHGHCHIVGKFAEDWDDQEELERQLLPDHIVEELFALRYEISTLREKIADYTSPLTDLLINSVGQSDAFKQVCHLIKRASGSNVTVLLQGETGVGKEVVAKGLHLSSERADKAFIAVNCACIPPDLIESELFGVRKGAYTGATESREGKFERADGGTIFLDEVIELSPRAQATLLRVLQEGEMERVGDIKTRKINVRVVAASNENLDEAVKEGRFRADLFYRLNVFPVYIPPLRQRTEDIPLLIEHFLEKYHALYNKKTSGVSDKAMQALANYKWPGNIRELENMIERGIILTDNNNSIDMQSLFPSLIEPSHPMYISTRTGEVSPDDHNEQSAPDNIVEQLLANDLNLDELESQLLKHAMNKTDGNIAQAARLLGITRPQMAYRLKKQQS
ncbi:sigma-54-dependent Fis family transcriptional regulator [Dasania marina]|uniref:sigma-54-dependent Fis family transcriptional regulator n=1 Tax=Dasania marina TaxID=471499 RepID=UPI00037B9F3B|nr:sigma-54-dependent Fis family transcriptional regulator [Dasania marina]